MLQGWISALAGMPTRLHINIAHVEHEKQRYLYLARMSRRGEDRWVVDYFRCPVTKSIAAHIPGAASLFSSNRRVKTNGKFFIGGGVEMTTEELVRYGEKHEQTVRQITASSLTHFSRHKDNLAKMAGIDLAELRDEEKNRTSLDEKDIVVRGFADPMKVAGLYPSSPVAERVWAEMKVVKGGGMVLHRRCLIAERHEDLQDWHMYVMDESAGVEGQKYHLYHGLGYKRPLRVVLADMEKAVEVSGSTCRSPGNYNNRRATLAARVPELVEESLCYTWRKPKVSKVAGAYEWSGELALPTNRETAAALKEKLLSEFEGAYGLPMLGELVSPCRLYERQIEDIDIDVGYERQKRAEPLFPRLLRV